VLFLMVDTEASFMERLEAAAVVLWALLGGVKLCDLARCDAVAAAEAEVPHKAAGAAGALPAAGAEATGAGAVTER
jgi:hypothetical protein